jgi:hypothetical protein
MECDSLNVHSCVGLIEWRELLSPHKDNLLYFSIRRIDSFVTNAMGHNLSEKRRTRTISEE